MTEALQSGALKAPRSTIYLPVSDGHQIPVLSWVPESPAIAGVHICHGMAEHAARYQPLGEMLAGLGYVVFAHNHRGHGPDTDPDSLGHFADQDGWGKVTADVFAVQDFIRSRYPALPQFLIGHSMGSFIAQGALLRNDGQRPFAGLVLSGSGRDPALKLAALRGIIASQRWLVGPLASSKLIRALTFGAFARTVKNRQTDFDWISRHPQTVADYIADPLCGFDCTTRLWQDLGAGLAELQGQDALKRIPADLPVLIISGDRDPVGGFGKGVSRLASAYRQNGHRDVTLNLLTGARHEPFNETNRAESYQILVDWLDRHRASD